MDYEMWVLDRIMFCNPRMLDERYDTGRVTTQALHFVDNRLRAVQVDRSVQTEGGELR